MENDDRQIGRVLSRREVLALFGSAGAALLVGCTPNSDPAQPTSAAATATSAPNATTAATQAATEIAVAPTEGAAATAAATAPAEATTVATATQGAIALPACIVRPEQTEGPYFVDERLDRSDIRSDPSDGSVREGAPFRLQFRVAQISGTACTPLAGAYVDVWHCDAAGTYSDVENAVGKKFLRGYQQTDENGRAEFVTIYPGWYPGRAVHIHFMIRTSLDSGQEFVSQLYFDDNLSDQILSQAPYAGRGERPTRNPNDGIFRAGGDQLTLQVSEEEGGYVATFDIGLQL